MLEALWSMVEPNDLRWILLTHDDNDHAGNLKEVMEAAPNARVVLNWIGSARMEDSWPIPMDRVFFINPGQSIEIGDRRFTAMRPPLFDSPASLSFYDEKAETLFGADSFGAIIPEIVQDARDVPEEALIEGLHVFGRAVSPWSTMVDQAQFDRVLEGFRRLEAKTIVSCHSPVSHGLIDRMLKVYSGLPSMEPFVGPDQATLDAMMAEMAKGGGSP
jgi:flavorubredoxin